MRDILLILAGFGIITYAVASFAPRIGEIQRQRIDNYSAVSFETFTTAAKDFVIAEYDDLLASVTANVTIVTPAALIAAGVLDASFQDQNTFQQSHALLLRQPAAGDIQVLAITFGGEEMPPVENVRLAQHAGQYAGLIHVAAPTEIRGAGGGWVIDPADFNTAPPAQRPAAGHLMAYVPMGAAKALAPYLYRFPHSNPDANTMFTDLNMDGNNITDVGDLLLSDGSGGVIRHTGIHASNETIAKPSCAAGLTPKIYVAPVQFSDNGTGLPLIAANAYAVDVSSAEWRVEMRVITQDTAGTGTLVVEPTTTFGRALVLTRCQ